MVYKNVKVRKVGKGWIGSKGGSKWKEVKTPRQLTMHIGTYPYHTTQVKRGGKLIYSGKPGSDSHGGWETAKKVVKQIRKRKK